jgi:hypothetical protein
MHLLGCTLEIYLRCTDRTSNFKCGECIKTHVYFLNYLSLFRIWKIHDEIRTYSTASVSRNICGERWSGLPGNPYHRVENPWYRFIHSVVCLAVGQQPVLHRLRASDSSSGFQYPITSLSSSSSCLRLLPCLQVTFILPSIFPSITYYRKQFTRKIWPIQLPVLLSILCRAFLTSLTPYIISFLTQSVHNFFQSSPGPQVKPFQVFLIYFLKCPSFSPTQSFIPM